MKKIPFSQGDILKQTQKAYFIRLSEDRGFWIPKYFDNKKGYLELPDDFEVTTKSMDYEITHKGDVRIDIHNHDDKKLTNSMITKKENLDLNKIMYDKYLNEFEKERKKFVKSLGLISSSDKEGIKKRNEELKKFEENFKNNFENKNGVIVEKGKTANDLTFKKKILAV
ncbi:hypothetical protein CJY68_08835 [Campylobacter coli]|nr:hypothetical protein [Campylobacter coli]